MHWLVNQGYDQIIFLETAVIREETIGALLEKWKNQIFHSLCITMLKDLKMLRIFFNYNCIYY